MIFKVLAISAAALFLNKKKKVDPGMNGLDTFDWSLDGLCDEYSNEEIKELGIIGNGMGKVGGKSVYQVVNDKLIKLLTKGEIPWINQRNHNPIGAEFSGRFINFKTKKAYKGINPWNIMATMEEYHCDYFLSKKQIADAGGTLRKDATRFQIIFTGKISIEEKGKPTESNPKGETTIKNIPFLRMYDIYNLADTTGIDWKHTKHTEVKKQTEEAIESCESIYTKMPKKPKLTISNNDRAYYAPALDSVTVPNKKHFTSIEGYYRTLFHELVHSTGHKSRLNREQSMEVEKYAMEEIIAEAGASYICAYTGILGTNLNKHASYIQHYIKEFHGVSQKRYASDIAQICRNDKTFIFRLASQAQKAANYILSKQLKELKNGNKKPKSVSKSIKNEIKTAKTEIKPKKVIDNIPSVFPDKSKKASIQQAIKDVLTLPKYRNYSEMVISMLFNEFKNQELILIDDLGTMKRKVFENIEEDLIVSEEGWYMLSEKGMHLQSAIEGRLRTLKAKKQGNDMFPHLAGK